MKTQGAGVPRPTYPMTEEECEKKTGHCWHTPIIRVCQHCGKEERGPRRPVPLRPGPRPEHRIGIGRDCLICGDQWIWAFWHRLTRGHWPMIMGAKR